MTTNFPSSIDAFTNPTSGSSMSSPSHAGQHADANDAIEAIETALLDGAPLHIDDANERVGINDTTPSYTLDVDGDINATGDVRVAGNPVGMVLVKTQTIGSGVSNVQINSAFSSTFDNYKISISGITMSASTGNSMYVRLSSGGTTAVTNYQYAMAKVDIANGAITGVNAQNSSVMFIGKGVGDKFGTTFDVVMPYISTHTIFPNIGGIETSTGYAFSGIGQHQTTASYDGFRIQPLTGTITGGTIRVYGYNNG